jgi:hypothetical protein
VVVVVEKLGAGKELGAVPVGTGLRFKANRQVEDLQQNLHLLLVLRPAMLLLLVPEVLWEIRAREVAIPHLAA